MRDLGLLHLRLVERVKVEKLACIGVSAGTRLNGIERTGSKFILKRLDLLRLPNHG